MAVKRVDPEGWYEYADHAIPLCGTCVLDDLEKTARGEYTGDEAVTLDMVHELADADTEPYQCDGCLKQNEAYDNEY